MFTYIFICLPIAIIEKKQRYRKAKLITKKIDQIISKLLTLSKFFTCILIAEFCFAHEGHF